MINRVKESIKRFFTNKNAFSLVELIVVVAIMAVMAAVLAPALLGYVEKSRMQKDDSVMSEITNAIHLSLADQEIYDELLQASVKDNYSCYCDEDTTTNVYENKILLNNRHSWLFNDRARLLDETVYKPAGKMRGVTITFKPNGSAEYILKSGIVNQIGDESTKKGAQAGKTLENSAFEAIYNRIRSTIGDALKVSSQTYRNSDYTIFISMGTTGGSQADAQDAIQVWGQFNGTNLNDVASPISGSSQHGAPIEDLNNVNPTLKDNTWEEIHQVVSAGRAEEAGWTVGSTAKLQINNKTYTAMIIGLDHDGENTATFMITDYDQRFPMNTTTTNEGGWENSNLRSILNQSFLNTMNNKEFIKPVNKLTANSNDRDAEATITKDYIFLLSMDEFGLRETATNSDFYLAREGNVYEWFIDNSLTRWSWTRSLPRGTKQGFYTEKDGDASIALAGGNQWIEPVFVIG